MNDKFQTVALIIHKDGLLTIKGTIQRQFESTLTLGAFRELQTWEMDGDIQGDESRREIQRDILKNFGMSNEVIASPKWMKTLHKFLGELIAMHEIEGSL